MAGKYTKAQQNATNGYRSKMARIDLTITVEEKEMVKAKAEAAGLSIKQYIMQIVKMDR